MAYEIKSIEIPAGESGKSIRTILVFKTGEINIDEAALDYLVDHPEKDKDLPAGLLGLVVRKRKKANPVLAAKEVKEIKEEKKVEAKAEVAEKPSKKL